MTRDLSQAWHGAAFSRARRLPDLTQTIRTATRGGAFLRTKEEHQAMEESARAHLRSLGHVTPQPNGDAS